MAFSKKTWKDRQVEHPGRRRLSNTGTTDVYDVTREEGLVIEEGDALNAANFNDLENRVSSAFSESALKEIFTLTHSKSGTTHALTGLSGASGTVSAVFTTTAAYTAGDTFTVDGTAYTVQLSNGETAEDNLFVAGAAVPIVLDTAGKKVNFKAGGGLASSALALATATEADVSSGKTFYAGNKILKTGTAGRYVYGQINQTEQTVSCGFKPRTIIMWSGLAYKDNKNWGEGGWIHLQNGNVNSQMYLAVNHDDDNGGFYGDLQWIYALTDTGFTVRSRDAGNFGNATTWYYVAME